MDLIRMTGFKLKRTSWLVIMLILPIVYGIVLYWYLDRFDNLEQVFYLYAAYFNCLLPFGVALLAGLYIQYEEQVGHFNHLLQLPHRGKWLVNMIFFTWLSVGISTAITCVPLWLLVGSAYNLDIIYYFLFTTVFSLPIIVFLWFISLKMNMGICLGLGALISLFLVFFGANSLIDVMQMYVPILYGDLSVLSVTNNLSFLIFIMFIFFTVLLLITVLYWFKSWEGRTINE